MCAHARRATGAPGRSATIHGECVSAQPRHLERVQESAISSDHLNRPGTAGTVGSVVEIANCCAGLPAAIKIQMKTTVRLPARASYCLRRGTGSQTWDSRRCRCRIHSSFKYIRVGLAAGLEPIFISPTTGEKNDGPTALCAYEFTAGRLSVLQAHTPFYRWASVPTSTAIVSAVHPHPNTIKTRRPRTVLSSGYMGGRNVL